MRFSFGSFVLGATCALVIRELYRVLCEEDEERVLDTCVRHRNPAVDQRALAALFRVALAEMQVDTRRVQTRAPPTPTPPPSPRGDLDDEWSVVSSPRRRANSEGSVRR